jgi:diguanylate cyclase (GGDEF)-like protein
MSATETPRVTALPVATPKPTTIRRTLPDGVMLLLFPLLHYLSIKLTFATAFSPENEVVIWFGNALLLAALLHYRGRHVYLLAALSLASDIVANLPVFPLKVAVLLSGFNLLEVMLAFGLMQWLRAHPALVSVRDFAKMIVAGPVVACLVAALLAGHVLQSLDGVSASYGTLVLLWWYGDALGLLILTPFLLSYVRGIDDAIQPLRWWDFLVASLTVLLALFIFVGWSRSFTDTVFFSPAMLLPGVLYVAVRFPVRWTARLITLITLAAAWSQTTGHRPFGNSDAHAMILHAQEFIFILGVLGLGFALLVREQRLLARDLETRVIERTQALEASNAKLAALSRTDGLTGVANRRRFDEMLATEWARSQREGTSLALLMLDVDQFKAYNDRYGHQAGDDCLRSVAQTIAAQMRRGGDEAARYGGEEFAVLCANTDLAGARVLAETIGIAVRKMSLAHADTVSGIVTVSIGVAAAVPVAQMSTASLVQRADAALYQAKDRGRDRVELG